MPVRGLQGSAPPSVRVGTSAWLEAAGGGPAVPAGVSCVSGSGAARRAAVKVGSVRELRVSAEALVEMECGLSGPMVDALSRAPRWGSDGESLPEVLLETRADSCPEPGLWTRETRERGWRGAGPAAERLGHGCPGPRGAGHQARDAGGVGQDAAGAALSRASGLGAAREPALPWRWT